MKRIYIFGAAFILLALLAGGLYLNNFRKLNSGDKALSSLPVATPAAAPDMSVPAPQITDNSSADLFVESKNGNRHRHLKNKKSSAEPSYIFDDASPSYEKDIAVNVSNPDADLKVEKSQVYNGNAPRASKRMVKVPHTNFSLPDGLGLELGYNQASLYNNNTANIPVGNFTVGLLMNFNLGNHLAVQPGLRYINKGNRLMSNEDVETQEKLALHYLEVPANLIWKFGKVGNARFMIGAGPYAAYLVGTKEKFQTPGLSDGSDVLPSSPQYSVNNIRKFDWGVGGFIGIQSPEGLFIKAGTEYGLTDIMKNADGTTDNRNYSLLVTAGFILGGK